MYLARKFIQWRSLILHGHNLRQYCNSYFLWRLRTNIKSNRCMNGIELLLCCTFTSEFFPYNPNPVF